LGATVFYEKNGSKKFRDSELAREIYGERLPQRILSNARTFVNVAQHLHDFGRFEMNKRDLGRQREDRILVAEEEILHEMITSQT
jgi:hypothetical protein